MYHPAMRPTPASSPLRAIALPLVVIALALAPATAARAAGDARPLTLHAAYKLALGSNPTIELLDQRVRAVEAARRAAWVALKPTAGVQLAYTYYNQRIALDPADFIPAGLVPPANLPGEIVIQQRNQLSLSAQVNVPLFRGAAYQGIGAARRQVAAARLRRVRSLEEEGVIRGYHADLDPSKLGFSITVFAMVSLKSQAEADLRQFEEHVRGLPEVRECHMLNGEIDFILKIVSRDLQSFQEFLTSRLTPAPNVASVKTSLTIRTAKLLPGVPMD